MLVVAVAVEREIGRAGSAFGEAVVLGQTAELGARDVGLARLDGIQHSTGLERILTTPRLGAMGRLHPRLAVERRVQRGREVVPEGDVLALLGRVRGIAYRCG